MTITYDEVAQAVHIRFRRGQVADTIEIEPLVLVDVDDQGQALGIEFVDAEDLLPFLGRHGGILSPESLRPLVALPASGSYQKRAS